MKSVFRSLMDKAIVANRAKHKKIESPHAALALIQEEVGELKEDVEKRHGKDDPFWLLNELIEIAALCEMAAADVVAKKGE